MRADLDIKIDICCACQPVTHDHPHQNHCYMHDVQVTGWRQGALQFPPWHSACNCDCLVVRSKLSAAILSQSILRRHHVPSTNVTFTLVITKVPSIGPLATVTQSDTNTFENRVHINIISDRLCFLELVCRALSCRTIVSAGSRWNG